MLELDDLCLGLGVIFIHDLNVHIIVSVSVSGHGEGVISLAVVLLVVMVVGLLGFLFDFGGHAVIGKHDGTLVSTVLGEIRHPLSPRRLSELVIC